MKLVHGRSLRERLRGVGARRIPTRWARALFAGMAFALFALLGIGLVVIRGLSKDLPSPERLQSIRPPTKTLLFSANGDTLHEFYVQNRVPIRLEDAPPGLVQAIIATEDRRFYAHYGVDLGGMIRSVWVNLRTGRRSQGGSTITQQLARSLFLTPTKQWERKMREILLALQIEKTYTKDEILEMYLNAIYFGPAYGFEAASHAFFGKSVRDLQPAEYTLLAGVLNNPGIYSPIRHLDRAYKRRDVVLRSMVDAGYMRKEDAAAIADQPVTIRPAGRDRVIAPYFIEYVRQYLEQRFGVEQLYEEGLRVYTTLDARMQAFAEEALEEHLTRIEGQQNYDQTRRSYDEQFGDLEEQPPPEYLQGALLAMDARNGAILAMIGGRDYEASKFNRAVQAQRQPGSLFKPYVYAAALQQGLTPADILLDAPVEIDTGADELWRPVNYDETFRGPVTVREALAGSINVAAVRVILDIKPRPVIEVARQMGIRSSIPAVYSIALGAGEANLLELVDSYCAFANHGILPRPYFFTTVTNVRGEVLEETRPDQQEALDERVSYMMVDLMRTAIREGTGASARAYGWSRDSAGKTGTTDLNTDAWFIGFTPDVVCGVWTGFDRKVSMGRKKTGAVMALPVWASTMTRALEGTAETHFDRPEGIVERFVCRESGKLASPACAESYREIFIEGQDPGQVCPIHQPGASSLRDRTADFRLLDDEAARANEFGEYRRRKQ
jgi:penicillin-binding protein 1A